MSNEGWSPKPRRSLNLNGIFSHEDNRPVRVKQDNRWQHQRANDGTPHTISGPTAWSPPAVGPKLVLKDLEDAKKSKSDSAKYTKPALRERLKRQVMAGEDGGKAGQWSARKAQILAQKYKAAGGGYKGKKSSSQRSLSKWTKEDWQTSDGKPAERKGGMARYLPKKAWDKLSAKEKAATNKKKREGSKKGKQFVSNTKAAKTARRKVTKKSASENPEEVVKAYFDVVQSLKAGDANGAIAKAKQITGWDEFE